MLNTAALFIPVFLLIVLVEWYISYRKKDKRFVFKNTAMNVTIGAIDQLCSIFYFALLYIVLQYVYNHFRLIEISNLWYQWIIGYLAVDFISYWYHRFSHRINLLWAGHITHHSSEHFNLSNGFRTSPFQGLNRIVFWAILPVFGFSPIILVLILKISGIYDFLLHTQYVPKLGWLEKIIITPSLHRVHHGKNDIYIDKNYGSTFVIWDKLFGTFQGETEPVVFGIKSNYLDNNPINAIGGHYRYLWNTMKSTKNVNDKLKVLVMPPEWNIKDQVTENNYKPVKKMISSVTILNVLSIVLLCCSAGIIALLVFWDFLNFWELIIFSVIGVSIMTASTVYLNQNIFLNSK
jgi:alkylglycerol monooxygenase